MNRRGFLRSLFGLAGAAALPAKALSFLVETQSHSDEAFSRAALDVFGSIRNVQLYARALTADELRMMTS